MASTFGYTTTSAVSRDARRIVQNRDLREQALIHHGKVPPSLNPTASLTQSAGYASECDRLQTNAARALRQQRDAARQQHDAVTTTNRNRNLYRQEQQEVQRVAEHQKNLEDGARLAGTSLRNNSSVPYDVITHDFTNETARITSQYKDDMTKHGFMLRTKRLESKLNPEGYNIINGAERRKIEVPPKPAPLQF